MVAQITVQGKGIEEMIFKEDSTSLSYSNRNPSLRKGNSNDDDEEKEAQIEENQGESTNLLFETSQPPFSGVIAKERPRPREIDASFSECYPISVTLKEKENIKENKNDLSFHSYPSSTAYPYSRLNTHHYSHTEDLASSICSSYNENLGESFHNGGGPPMSNIPLSQHQNIHSNMYLQQIPLDRVSNSNQNLLIKSINNSTILSDNFLQENNLQSLKSNMEMIDRLKRVIHIQENQIACLEGKVVNLAKDSQYIEDKYIEANDKKEELALLCKHLKLKLIKQSQEKQHIEGEIEQINDFKASLEVEKDNIISDCAHQLSVEKERNQNAESELWSQNEALQKEIESFKEKIQKISNLESKLKVLEENNTQLEEEAKAKDGSISDLKYELKEMSGKVEDHEEVLSENEILSKKLIKKEEDYNTLKDKFAHQKIELDTTIARLMLEEEKLELEIKHKENAINKNKMLKSKLETSIEEMSTLEEKLGTSNNLCSKSAKEIGRLLKEMDELKEVNLNYEQEVEDISEAFRSLEQSVTKDKDRIKTLETENEQLKNDYDKFIKEEKQSLTINLQDMTDRVLLYKEDIDALKKANEISKETQNKMEENMEKEAAKYNENLSVYQSSIEALEKKCKKYKVELERQKMQKQVLEEDKAELQGQREEDEIMKQKMSELMAQTVNEIKIVRESATTWEKRAGIAEIALEGHKSIQLKVNELEQENKRLKDLIQDEATKKATVEYNLKMSVKKCRIFEEESKNWKRRARQLAEACDIEGGKIEKYGIEIPSNIISTPSVVSSSTVYSASSDYENDSENRNMGFLQQRSVLKKKKTNSMASNQVDELIPNLASKGQNNDIIYLSDIRSNTDAIKRSTKQNCINESDNKSIFRSDRDHIFIHPPYLQDQTTLMTFPHSSYKVYEDSKGMTRNRFLNSGTYPNGPPMRTKGSLQKTKQTRDGESEHINHSEEKSNEEEVQDFEREEESSTKPSSSAYLHKSTAKNQQLKDLMARCRSLTKELRSVYTQKDKDSVQSVDSNENTVSFFNTENNYVSVPNVNYNSDNTSQMHKEEGDATKNEENISNTENDVVERGNHLKSPQAKLETNPGTLSPVERQVTDTRTSKLHNNNNHKVSEAENSATEKSQGQSVGSDLSKNVVNKVDEVQAENSKSF